MTTTTTPDAPGQQVKAPIGGRRSRIYFDAQGRRHTARIPVPVNDYGQISQSGWACRKCSEPKWLALNLKAVPVCTVHDLKMRPYQLRRAPLLPYRALWDVCEKPLRPVWALPGMAACGQIVDAAHLPALVVAGTAPVALEATRRVWRSRAVKKALANGDLERGDDEYGKKLRAAIDAAARKAGYTAGAGMGWLAAVAALGLDPSTVAGKLAWTLALAPWLPAAATYWRKLREARRPKPNEAAGEPEPEPEVDADQARVMRIWRTVVAQYAGDIVGKASDQATPIKATQNGKLAGAKLSGWRKIRGGWAATIEAPPGMYEAESFVQAKGKIASAYSVTKAMVSLVPDGEDENRCGLFVQKASVISEDVPWVGPDSVNAQTGLAPLVQYIDGTVGMYELYRPGWGCPHELYIGTTGAAKSSALEQVFTIDRWAHYTDAQGRERGIIADFLIDPQQGQSFGAFMDDLAAPVAATADEAMMLVRAFRREMLRRNKYLSRKPWTDDKGRPRRGAKWWNPLEDGTMLFLTIDEAHEFLAIREFAALITAGARMYRKCGLKIRVATHTPLLSDLGGSMALRDMLTGGFVWMGRTANSLSGPVAFNGRLPADPKTIPEVPGAAYILSAIEKKPMLARTMYQDDYYDFIRDADNNPIGFPGELSAETLKAFGEEYADWLRFVATQDVDEGGLWTPDADSAQPVKVEQSDEFLQNMVMWALEQASEPLDMNGLDEALHVAEVEASLLAVRDALAMFRGRGLVVSRDGRHELSPRARAERDAKLREAQAQVDALLEQDAA